MVSKFENSTYKDIKKYKEYRKKQKEKERLRIKKYFESLKTECFFCGSKYELVFHHINPNEKTGDVANRKSKKSMLEEMKKCWCLCENCHIKLHQRLCDPLPETYDTKITVL